MLWALVFQGILLGYYDSSSECSSAVSQAVVAYYDSRESKIYNYTVSYNLKFSCVPVQHPLGGLP